MEPDYQISSEQIVKDVLDKRKQKSQATKSNVDINIQDLEELKDLQGRKRTEYETYLKRNRLDMGQWLRYADFEIQQHDIRRARSIFERAMLVDSSYIPLWIRYIDTEIKNEFINHARNLLNRAVNILPRVDKLWYKYLILEESIGNIDITRSLFNKWISLEPNVNAWDSFIDFEIRQKKWNEVRNIYSKYVLVHPQYRTWDNWFLFEKKYGTIELVRKTYVFALDTLQSYLDVTNKDNEQIFDNLLGDIISIVIHFSSWEASQAEYERSRALIRFALEQWPEQKVLRDYQVDFEKSFGKDFENIESNIIRKRKQSYEHYLINNPRDYDTWWIYLDLIEKYFVVELLDIYNQCVINSKPETMKKTIEFERYICIWIRYLIFVEKTGNDTELCRTLYNDLISNIIPHKEFTYPLIWIMYANFEIRQDNISNARKIMGRAIGICPSDELFRSYISIEIKLKEFDRVRKLYEKYIEFKPNSEELWIQYAELESNLGDEVRARGILESALNSSMNCFNKDSKNKLFKSLIEIETESGNYDKVRVAYQKYLRNSDFDKSIWIEYATFVLSTPTEDQLKLLTNNSSNADSDEELEFSITEENINNARKIFEQGLMHTKLHNKESDRVFLFNAYEQFEETYGDSLSKQALSSRLPVKSKIKFYENGIEKETFQYLFPDDNDTLEKEEEKKPDISKMFKLAKEWESSQTG
ncbi:hypothetical protein TPHA_0C00900 [Tetrapisispora phaffii CBS 4417]|uniref:Pre-mRNA-splicing factor CLF1 n=1 Tax=Tetrapisispora phaffii (strain ATCC 24235 / CBS 4417 / NBRC 1672 / NRRL Y-8282 / UCD 70-5) TaxID=1071381 RepID=G8BR70_TETPH|nr:hypothetical protein TPHA_0C00900 [Tetrapisispora phaffii CBS 4417]CCE62246.1 hypothetical protein TPHA_0C00900 [Tetrapisispora phaffii CBS 4417]